MNLYFENSFAKNAWAWNDRVDPECRDFLPRTVFSDWSSDWGYFGFLWKLVLRVAFSRYFEGEEQFKTHAKTSYPTC